MTTVVSAECPHFWKIAPPRSMTSSGRCKFCGERRQFSNMLPEGKRKYHPWRPLGDPVSASAKG